MQHLTVSDLMRECRDVVVDETTTIRSAAEKLICQTNPLLVACDSARRVSGILPEEAVVRSLLNNSGSDVTVASVMSRHVQTVRSTASFVSVLPLFRSSCHIAVPVVDNEDVVIGLLYRSDIVRLLLSDEPAADARSAQITRPHYMDARRQSSSSQRRSDRAEIDPDGIT